MKMTRDRKVKFQKKSRESRLSQVTGERLLEIPCKTSQGNQPAITVCMSRFVPGQCQGPGDIHGQEREIHCTEQQ